MCSPPHTPVNPSPKKTRTRRRAGGRGGGEPPAVASRRRLLGARAESRRGRRPLGARLDLLVCSVAPQRAAPLVSSAALRRVSVPFRMFGSTAPDCVLSAAWRPSVHARKLVSQVLTLSAALRPGVFIVGSFAPGYIWSAAWSVHVWTLVSNASMLSAALRPSVFIVGSFAPGCIW